jgi:hypothetical protein
MMKIQSQLQETTQLMDLDGAVAYSRLQKICVKTCRRLLKNIIFCGVLGWCVSMKRTGSQGSMISEYKNPLISFIELGGTGKIAGGHKTILFIRIYLASRTRNGLYVMLALKQLFTVSGWKTPGDIRVHREAL